MPKTETLSIIVPMHNEANNVKPLYRELQKVEPELDNLELEFVFVNDGSTDDTQRRLRHLAKRDERVVVLEFVRNFGKEAATTAGLHACTGDAAIMLDADMQHPPALIPKFVKKWRDGSLIMVGVRSTYGKESFFKRKSSELFYALFNKISEIPIQPGATDFRLLDREVIDEFNRFTERNRITRGLIDWLGYTSDTIYFRPSKRIYGNASYSYRKLIRLAFNSFVSMSLFPLKITGYIGVVITTVSGLWGLFILVQTFILGDPLKLQLTGTAVVVSLLVFLVGIMMCALGLIALYIAQIHTEVSNRPLYVLRRPSTRKEADEVSRR